MRAVDGEALWEDEGERTVITEAPVLVEREPDPEPAESGGAVGRAAAVGEGAGEGSGGLVGTITMREDGEHARGDAASSG